jgi:hypothetical protein
MKYLIILFLLSIACHSNDLFEYYQNPTSNISSIIKIDNEILALTPFDIIKLEKNGYENKDISDGIFDFDKIVNYENKIFIYKEFGSGYIIKDGEFEKLPIQNDKNIIFADANDDNLFIITSSSPYYHIYDGSNWIHYRTEDYGYISKDEIKVEKRNNDFYISFRKEFSIDFWYDRFNNKENKFENYINPSHTQQIKAMTNNNYGLIYNAINKDETFINCNIGIRKIENGQISEEIKLEDENGVILTNFAVLNENIFAFNTKGIYEYDESSSSFSRFYSLEGINKNPELFRHKKLCYFTYNDQVFKFDGTTLDSIKFPTNWNFFLVEDELIATSNGEIKTPFNNLLAISSDNQIKSNSILAGDIYFDELVLLSEDRNSRIINEFTNSWIFNSIDSLGLEESWSYSIYKTGHGNYHIANIDNFYVSNDFNWEMYPFEISTDKDTIVIQEVTLFGKDNNGYVYGNSQIDYYPRKGPSKRNFFAFKDGEHKMYNIQNEPFNPFGSEFSYLKNDLLYTVYESTNANRYILKFSNGELLDQILIQKYPSNIFYSRLSSISVQDETTDKLVITRNSSYGWNHQVGSYTTKGGLSYLENGEWSFVSKFPNHPKEDYRKTPYLIWYGDYVDYKLMYSGGLIYIKDGFWYLLTEIDGYNDIKAFKVIDYDDRAILISSKYGAVEFAPSKFKNFTSVENIAKLKFFQNPNSITLKNKLGKDFLLYDFKGKLLKKQTITSKNFSFSTEEFKSGVYFIKLIDDNQIESNKFIISN